MKKRIKNIVFLLLVFVANASYAQKVNFNGQAVGWLTINPSDPFSAQTGLRYIPEIKYIETYESNISFEAFGSLNMYANQIFWQNDSMEFDYDVQPYRFWVRYSGKRLEFRGGLQKINFGSAQLLRPLMWFDKIDPRDPLQLTDGVYGALGRYYFLNNANIWLWALIANDETKGWELFPSVKDKPELGGRIQIPFFTGEIATTYHFRKANIENTFADSLTNNKQFKENRFGIDFKLDYAIGFWTEFALTHQDVDFTSDRYTKMLTVGADYTFNVGSGLTMLAEYFTLGNDSKAHQFEEAASFVAFSINYPVTFIQSFGAMLYYDFDNKAYYRFINWTWQFDKWSFFAMAFWNPDQFQIYQSTGGAALFAGKGFQLMAVYNH